MTPARGVGGDFYNFIMIDDDHLALLIADVSGKGIPGALCMMVSNTRLLQRTYEGGSPAEILGSVNEWICRNNKTGMFVTVWLRILELSTGKLKATNRGKKMFGTERMLAALSAEPDASPEKTLANVSDALKAFVKEAEQFDDLTMMCLEYRG